MALLFDEQKLSKELISQIIDQKVHEKLAGQIVTKFLNYEVIKGIKIKHFLIATLTLLVAVRMKKLILK